MKPNPRMAALEAKVNALTLVIEKQNETIAMLTSRVEAIEKAPAITPTETAYKPLFDRWPGSVR